MKKISLILVAFAITNLAFTAPPTAAGPSEGAWNYTEGDVEHVAVFVDGYFSHTKYDLQGKRFISTRGGTYDASGSTISVVWQYDTDKAGGTIPTTDWLGKTTTFTFAPGVSGLQTDITGSEGVWSQIDQNQGELAGVWRISGRKQDDEVRAMPLRDRRTLKILSGTRFQWVAINIATGEFSGTGGGTYTFENGKYTENIEFFSRDNNRVGASLTFDGKMEDGNWHHSGLSSTGNPIYEIWEKLED